MKRCRQTALPRLRGKAPYVVCQRLNTSSLNSASSTASTGPQLAGFGDIRQKHSPPPVPRRPLRYRPEPWRVIPWDRRGTLACINSHTSGSFRAAEETVLRGGLSSVLTPAERRRLEEWRLVPRTRPSTRHARSWSRNQKGQDYIFINKYFWRGIWFIKIILFGRMVIFFLKVNPYFSQIGSIIAYYYSSFSVIKLWWSDFLN